MLTARYLAASLLGLTAFGQSSSPIWDVSLANCKRNSTEFGCFLNIHNKTQRPNIFYFNWTANSPPITVAAGNDGRKYSVQRVYVHGPATSPPGNGSTPDEYTVSPGATVDLNFYFLGPIPRTLTKLTALDVSFGHASSDGRTLTPIHLNYHEVPLLSMPDASRTAWWQSPLAMTLYLYGYALLMAGVFLFHRRVPGFARSVLVYCAIATAAACLVQYGSAFSMGWDYSRWHWGEQFGLLPLRISNDAQHPDAIPKLSLTYWFFTVLITLLFISFPQAVLNGSGLYLAHKSWLVKLLRGIAKLCGIGLGFFAVILTFTSLFAPFPCTAWLLMLIGCAVAVALVGADIVTDLKQGTEQFIPGGGGLVRNVSLLVTFARLWRA